VRCELETSPVTAPLNLIVRDSGEPLEGVWVCESETENCEHSDASGRVTIELPIRLEISYTLEKEGYASFLTPDILGPNGSSYPRSLFTDDAMAEQHERVGAQYPMISKGSILIDTTRPPSAGVTFELVGATGTRFYMDEEGRWNPNLTETTLPVPRGGFVEVTPGEHHVRVGGTAIECDLRLAWPDDDEKGLRLRLPVREGFVTRASVQCITPP